MRTNKKELSKGLKIMAITLVMMFVGPIMMYIAFSNKEKTLYIPILIGSLIFCAGAIFFGFKGINIIMNSMFKNTNSN